MKAAPEGVTMAKPTKSPSERASARLVGLIQNTDAHAGASGQFDPWDHAEIELKFRALQNTPAPASEVDEAVELEYFRLKDVVNVADNAWEGPLLHRPKFQVRAAINCLEKQKDIESGDGFAVMESIAQCAAHGLVLPAWLAASFIERYERVLSGASKGWGEYDAFGSVVPKGQNIARVVANAKFKPWAYEVALELLSDNPQRPIDTGFFEDVGGQIGRKSTTVQALIKHHCGDGLFAPLKYVKDELLTGKTLEEIVCNWVHTRHVLSLKKMGFEHDSLGNLVEVDVKKF